MRSFCSLEHGRTPAAGRKAQAELWKRGMGGEGNSCGEMLLTRMIFGADCAGTGGGGSRAAVVLGVEELPSDLRATRTDDGDSWRLLEGKTPRGNAPRGR